MLLRFCFEHLTNLVIFFPWPPYLVVLFCGERICLALLVLLAFISAVDADSLASHLLKISDLCLKISPSHTLQYWKLKSKAFLNILHASVTFLFFALLDHAETFS